MDLQDIKKSNQVEELSDWFLDEAEHQSLLLTEHIRESNLFRAGVALGKIESFLIAADRVLEVEFE